MMEHLHLVAVGRVIKHFIGALLIAWQRAFRAGFIAGIIGILSVEIGAIILTQQFPPPGVTHLVAGAMAIALGLGVGLTVVADEIINGIIDSIRLLIGEAGAGVRQAERIAEREVGDVRGAALRLTGLDTLMRRLAPRDAPNPELAPDAPRRPARPGIGTLSTAAILAALASPAVAGAARQRAATSGTLTGDTLTGPTIGPLKAVQTPPATDVAPAPPAVEASPTAPAADQPFVPPVSQGYGTAAPNTVPLTASEQLQSGPSEQESQQLGMGESPLEDERDAISQTPTVPRSSASIPPAQAAPPTIPLDPAPMQPPPAVTPAMPETPAAPVAAAPASGALAEPSVWHMGESPQEAAVAWHDPAQGGLDPEQEDASAGIQPVDTFGALPPGAGFRSRANTQPLPEGTQRAAPSTRPLVPRGSIWDHITNVVAGRQVEPFSPEDDVSSDGVPPEPPEVDNSSSS